VARGVDRNDVMLLSSLMRLVVAFLANTSYDLRIHAVVFAKVGWVFGSRDFPIPVIAAVADYNYAL
jgi:hypothetical protein